MNIWKLYETYVTKFVRRYQVNLIYEIGIHNIYGYSSLYKCCILTTLLSKFSYKKKKTV